MLSGCQIEDRTSVVSDVPVRLVTSLRRYSALLIYSWFLPIFGLTLYIIRNNQLQHFSK